MKHQPLLAARAAKLIQAAGIRRLRSRRAAAALADAGLLAWPAEDDPSGLPYGLSVRRLPIGVEVDTYRTVRALFAALAGEFADDPEGVAEEVVAIAAASGPDREAERTGLIDAMVERLGGSEIRYPSRSAVRLAERITQVAGPVLPAQQGRRSA